MSDEPLLYAKPAPGIATITLNRPDVLNAQNMQVRDGLWTFLHAANDDPDVRVLVFRGNGERAFSAGADLTEFGTAPSYVASRRARRERDIWGFMAEMTLPTVASIHGFAYGAGCEMALFCDIRIASDDATFALPEVTLGYIPSAGGTQTLPRIVPPAVAREMILTGAPIDAQRALAYGLVTRVVPRERLAAETDAVATAIAALDPDVVRATKEAMARGAGMPLVAALQVERDIAARLFADGGHR